MNNNLSALNEKLFEQLDRVSDPELKGEDFEKEIERSKTMCLISKNIIDSAKVTVDAFKLLGKGELTKDEMPKMLLESK